MGNFLAILCIVSGLSMSSTAGATDLAIRLTGKWLKMTQQFEANNTQSGEFEEAKRDAKIRYELRAEGFLSAFDQDKEFSDNKVIGVDSPGLSRGQLIKENGKFFWRLVREWKDKTGVEKKTEKSWEVEFITGDWAGFEKGNAIEVVLTKSAQEDWNRYHTELVVKFADDLRAGYAKRFPSVTVNAVQVEKITHKNGVRIYGDNKALTVDGSDSALLAKVVVNL